MEYMEQQMQTAMAVAEHSYRRDAAFRRFVDMSVAEAMRHLRHRPDGEIEERDIHHVAVTAAMAALRLSMDSDAVLAQMTAERDLYKKAAEEATKLSPLTILKPL